MPLHSEAARFEWIATMWKPDPNSRASAALRLIRRTPRTHAEIAKAIGCTEPEAYTTLYSLEKHNRSRRVYKPGVRREWWALAADARTPEGFLDAPDVDAGESPSLSAKALLMQAMALRGVSQADLERMTGMAQPHISAALSDSTGEPTWGTVAKLLGAMGYALDLVDTREVAASE